MRQSLTNDDPQPLGKVTLDARIGQGVPSTVYLGHLSDGTEVAAKVLRSEFARTEKLRSRFAAQAGAIALVHG